MTYLCQVNGTDPSKWTRYVSSYPRAAAVEFAVRKAKMREHCTVYVADSDATNLHPNGSPIAVHAFELNIQPTHIACSEGH